MELGNVILNGDDEEHTTDHKPDTQATQTSRRVVPQDTQKDTDQHNTARQER